MNVQTRTASKVLMMSRARAILVSLIPVLVLLASADCLNDSLSSCECNGLSCLLSTSGHGKQNEPLTDTSFDRDVERWSRRSNIQPGSDGFSSPVSFWLSQSVLPEQTFHPIYPPVANLVLAQAWQFHWRAASEPRAPSSVC